MSLLLTHKQVEEFILSKPGARLDYPFGDEVAVYKIYPNLLRQSGQSSGKEKPSSAVSRMGAYEDRATEGSTPPAAVSGGSVASSARKQAAAPDDSGKMFALIAEGKNPVRLSLKCDPLLAETLRAKYESVMPGYHLNKKHWNTIVLSGQIGQEEIFGLINHSYDLVLDSLSPQVKASVTNTS